MDGRGVEGEERGGGWMGEDRVEISGKGVSNIL